MAPPADEPHRTPFAEFINLLQPQPGRLEYAARLALVCALTALLAEIYQTPEPALTAYIAFFVVKPDRTESVVLSIVMLIVISMVIAVVLLATMIVINDPLSRVIVMTLLSFCLLFLTAASKLRPLGNTIALIAIYALALEGNAPFGEIAVRGFLYAWFFVGMPAGMSILVNLLLGPSPRRLAERALAHRLSLAAAMLREPDQRTQQEFDDVIDDGTGEIQTWLKLTGIEKTSPAPDIAALRQATASVASLMMLISALRQATDELLPDTTRQHIADTLAGMAAILKKGGYPVEIAPVEPTEEEVLSSDGAALLAEFNDILRQFTSADASPQQAGKAKSGFFLPDAFSNPAYIRYALKTTGAAMFCYILYSLLDWQGIHTCLITCYIVSLHSTAETVEKLGLRFLGCLFGAAVGIGAIVFLMPSVTSIGVLMAIIFLAAIASGWVAVGSPRISYAGFQFAFAFFLCVVQGSAPAFDLTIARDRAIGILLGNLVTYFAFTMFWPVSIADRIDPAFATVLRRLSAMVAATNQASRRLFAIEAQAALSALKQNIDLIRYEPASIRPVKTWLAARHRAAREIAALQGPLLLQASHPSPAADALPWSAVTQRLDRLAGDLENPMAGETRVTEESSQAEAGTNRLMSQEGIGDVIARHLDELEAALKQQSGKEETVRYAAV